MDVDDPRLDAQGPRWHICGQSRDLWNWINLMPLFVGCGKDGMEAVLTFHVLGGPLYRMPKLLTHIF